MGATALGRAADVALVLDQHPAGDDVGTHFGGIRIGTPAGDLHRGLGVARRRGDVDPLVGRARPSWPTTGSRTGSATSPPPTRPAATHELRGDILRVYGLPHRTGERHTVVNEGLARWTYEGRTGYGISEYLHQLDDEGRPAGADRVSGAASGRARPWPAALAEALGVDPGRR